MNECLGRCHAELDSILIILLQLNRLRYVYNDENRDGGRTMESSPDQKPRLGDQAVPEPRLIAASSGLVASNLVEGILGSINPGRRTEPLTSSQGQSSVVTTYDDLPGASCARILELIPAFIVVAIDATGLGIILPLLPFYSQRLGATPFIVGSLISVYALCQLVAGPLVGTLRHVRTQKYPNRQPDRNLGWIRAACDGQ